MGEEATSAFRWRNEAGNEEDMLTHGQGYYQWQWPVARLGDSWRGMFMRGDALYDIKNTPSCKGILPARAYTNLPVLGRDANETELSLLGALQRKLEKNETVPQDLLDSAPKERWLVFVPRFGLGNTLRGYISTFIFALLSGRRLLRWHGGPHKKVLNNLCDAFYCGIDELHYNGDIRKHGRLIDAITLEVIYGLEYSPTVVAVYSGYFFDKFWRKNPEINQCVHDAFGCTSLWCIRAKVLSLLLGNGPRPGVQEVVDRDLRVVPPLVPPLVLRGEEVGMKEGEVTGGKGPRPGVQEVVDRDLRVVPPLVLPGGRLVEKGEGLRLQFDVSIHIRGFSINVEGIRCAKEDSACREQAQQAELSRAHDMMRPGQWRCIARLLQFLRIKKAAAGGFTDATATAAAGQQANATAATAAADQQTNATAAADQQANATAAGGQQTNDTAGAADQPADATAVTITAGQQANATAATAAADQKANDTAGADQLANATAAKITAGLKANSTAAADHQANTAAAKITADQQANDTAGADQLANATAVTITAGQQANATAATAAADHQANATGAADQQANATETNGGKPNGFATRGAANASGETSKASINRRRLFENVQQNVKVQAGIHLDKASTGHLATLADFVLLSKGAALASFNRYISTFALFASMLGNGTLVADPAREHTCRFLVEHMGELWP
ncbi:unnamed protein product [Closterium sp. Yama58-4]|nr:unnamed protein product [Closterium sp. Yama58-4]